MSEEKYKATYFILVRNSAYKLDIFLKTFRSNLIELDLKSKDIMIPKKTPNALFYDIDLKDLFYSDENKLMLVDDVDFEDIEENFEYFAVENAFKLVDIICIQQNVPEGTKAEVYSDYESMMEAWLKSDTYRQQNVRTKNSITLKDVILARDTKAKIQQFIRFFKYRQKYDEIGATVPRGALLTGEPGTGKTLLAEAIASECDLEFKFICASEIMDKYVGSSAKNVKKIFDDFNGKPGILYIDEIDAIGMTRTGDSTAGQEHNNALNQLLSCMTDKIYEDIIIIGSTNLPDLLDPALMRSGRFDRKIVVAKPDYEGRKELFKLYLGKVKHQRMDYDYLAEITDGLVGADISTLVNLSAIDAVDSGRKRVALKDIEHELSIMKPKEVKTTIGFSI